MPIAIPSNTTPREDTRFDDVRKNRRYAVAERFIRVFWLDTNGDLKTSDRALPINVSQTGMAMLIPEEALLLSPIRLEYGTGELIGHGKVRYCHPSGELHIVGIEFTDSLQWSAPDGIIDEPIPLSPTPDTSECPLGAQSEAESDVATSGAKDLLWSEALSGMRPTSGLDVRQSSENVYQTSASPGSTSAFMSPPPALYLSLDSGADRGFFARAPMPVKIGALTLIALTLGSWILGRDQHSSSSSARSITTSVVGEQGWVTEWASDADGSRRGRQLTIYRPSRNLSNYQMQFTGQIENGALGWVMRATDTKNYYGMKIENYKPGSVRYTRFAVVNGRESSLVQKPLPIQPRADTSYTVKLEARGPRFAVYVQGEPVELWTDVRLKTGAFGLMNETKENGRASSIGFSF